ncbi:MAG: hypothetical protein KGS61_09070, partial [Verrucomicrobia bacterium]|nr:hypothetical protein [Verrucomicrobiota bacterium]
MKTRLLWVVRRAGLLAGAGAWAVCIDGLCVRAQSGDSPPASPPGPTNSVLATNLSAAASDPAASTNEPLAAIPPTIPVSAGLAEVVKLAQAGVEPDVLLAYVQNSPVAYNPTAEDLVYLHDVGIGPAVITAMIDHGKQVRDQAAQAMATASVAAPPPSDSSVPAVPPPENPTAPPTPDAQVAAAPPPVAGHPAESPAYGLPAPVVTPTADALPAPVNTFYDALAPYGTWYQLPDYGWCWQPSVIAVQPAWRPYFDSGRWLYSDCGWYWNSDYSWGWAPFHYGRWLRNVRFGWLWAPDTVWGPAWVCWRQTPVYCGWAPLPPGAIYQAGVGFTYFGVGVSAGFGFGLGAADFAFVPVGHFSDRNPVRYHLTPTLAQNVFNQTMVVNNYIQGPNNRILNLGVDRNRIAAATRSEIPTVAIRDLKTATAGAARPDRLERQGSALVVYRAQSPGTVPARSTSLVAPSPRQEWTAQTAANRGVGPRGQLINLSRPVASNPASGTTATLARNQFELSPEQRLTTSRLENRAGAPAPP